jgi:hypothetical protein
VAVPDEHARRLGLPSRSAAVQQAIGLLRHSGLEDDYAAAWEDWDASGERDAWEAVTGDGVS